MERGPANGLPQETAEDIFDMIEFFADYGFNKPHAADYAVITVQTAYLKCHYPEEYMTALLSVQRDDLTKVAVFLEECRRLDIPILPPDVNRSQLDFDIETVDDGRRAIRFGLGAIKNAGARALQDLVQLRGEAPFASLVDFCQRTDLRKLGRRTLESLIKVGALDSFGTRATLIAALDGIISFSSNYHRDQEVGQMVMFDSAAASDGDLLNVLKPIEEHSPRELLKWEKELLGLYLTGRPVDRHRHLFASQNLHSIHDLKDPASAKPDAVRVAGEITAMRKLTTGRGDMMAVLSLEDWHDSAGIIEVVLFPRTYTTVLNSFAAHNADLAEGARPIALAEGEIILINGTYDESRGEPQIIAERVSIDFNKVAAAEPLPEPMETGAMAWDSNGHPPAPEDDWRGPADAEFPPPDVHETAFSDPQIEAAESPEQPRDEGAEPEWVNGDGHLTMPDEAGTAALPPRHIAVVLEATDEPEKDKRKLGRIHNTLIGYPGSDKFSIVIRRGETEKSLVFPDTTQICDALLAALRGIVGGDEYIKVDDAGA